jgi:signal peptidase I
VTAAAPFRAGRWHLVRVVGESMLPTLRPGDVLLVRVGAEPRPGDVVVADLPGGRGAGVKRAARRDREGWWLERDSVTTGSDSWLFGAVADEDVRGVVRARLWPRPGRLARAPR